MIDAEVKIIERQSRFLEASTRWLQRARRSMVLALALLALGTLVEHLGG